ncbi:MAG: DUF11 domain-containing protein, partial [Erysipelotrichaceae bacterium]|nr:DUF11 domain-containing protein [Erysipelotrichaceae bacterium]
GNVKVKDIAITTLLGVVKEGDWSNFDLNPAEEKNFIATYTVSKEDMDKHKLIVNEVRASALSASDWAIAFTQTEDIMNDLKISVLTDKGDHLKANDQLSYTIEIKNEGKDTLSNIHMQATDLEGSEAFVKEGDWSAFELSSGESKQLKAFYTLSQLDVASQQALSHSFKVSAETSSGDILENEATACVQVEVKKPRLMVEMVADKGKDVKVGDNITYFIKVSNVGNSDLSMNAPSMSLMEVDWSSFDLKVNEDKTFMATYTVTQEAIDKGYYLDNKVCVDGGEVTEWALERLYLEDRKADIAVSMVADKARVENKDEIITYTITIKNRGNVTLKDIRVSEAMNTLTKVDDWTAFSLAPDGEKRLRATYTVTQRDEDQSDKLIRDIDVSATTMDGSRLSTSASAQVSVERKMIVLPSKADIEQQDMNVVVEEVNVEEIVPPRSFPPRILTVNAVEEVV